MASSAVIRLPAAPAKWEGQPSAAYSSIAVFVPKEMEHAGRAYHERAVGVKKQEAAESKSTLGLNFNDPQYDKYRADVDLGDFYALLGLGTGFVETTDEEIRKAYRIASLVCHPDKAKPGQGEYAEKRFKALNLAFETLTDPVRKRGYDSSIEFDDRIPGEKQGVDEKTFYKIYGPVFERNERFSEIKPCPKLGDAKSSADAVHAFYDFWLSFKSWRDFSYLNEHQIETASSREHKRMMIRENEKKQKEKKVEELKRVRKLAEDAMKKDPRIARIRAEEEAAKKAKKQAKYGEKYAKEAEAKRQAEEAAAKAAAEKKAKEESEAKQKEYHKAWKVSQKAFTRFCKANGIPEADYEVARLKYNLAEFDGVVAAAKTDVAKAKELYQQTWDKINAGAGGIASAPAGNEPAAQARSGGDASSSAAAAATPAPASAATPAKEEEKKTAASAPSSAAASGSGKPFSLEEQDALAKAVKKLPAGTQQRWEKITALVNALGGNRSEKEVIKKAKEMEMGIGTKVESDLAFTRYLANQQAHKRDEEHSKLKNMSPEEMKEYLKHKLEEEQKKKDEEEQRTRELELDIRRQEMELEKQKEKEEKRAREKKEKEEREAILRDQAAEQAKGSEDDESSSEEWSIGEQGSLETALKSVPKDAPDRWQAIANQVGSKTKKQCVDRFKYIRDQIVKAKQSS